MLALMLIIFKTHLCPSPMYLQSTHSFTSTLSIGSSVSSPTVSEAMDVSALAISIAISIGVSLLPSAASPVSRLLLLLPLTSVITSLKHTSSMLVVASSFVDTMGQSCFLPRLHVKQLNCVDSCAHPPPVVSPVLGTSLRGHFNVQNRLTPSVFQLVSLLSA